MNKDQGVQVTRKSHVEISVENTDYRVDTTIRDGFLVEATVIRTKNDVDEVIVKGFAELFALYDVLNEVVRNVRK